MTVIWKAYWAQAETPQHRHDSDFWFERYANEIKEIVLSLNGNFSSVLELGCGNGRLSQKLPINWNNYVGVDFSDSLLTQYQENCPDLELCLDDASKYKTNRKFDLIFSNGLIQYLKKEELQELIFNSSRHLNEGGSLLLANIPYKRLRRGYNTAEIRPPYVDPHKYPIRNRFRNSLHKLLRRTKSAGDSLGTWYNPNEIIKLIRLIGGQPVVFGSLYHPYRFSIAMTKGKSVQ